MTTEKKRILHIVSALDRGGVEKMLQNYQSHMSGNIVFDFITHRDNGSVGRWFLDHGSKIYRVAVRRRHPLISAIQTFRIVKTNHYNVVWFHGGLEICPELIASALAGARIRIIHAHECRGNLGFLSKHVVQSFIDPFASYRLACSRKAGEQQYEKKPFEILYNAINIDDYRWNSFQRDRLRDRLHIGSRFAAGHIGRCVPEKNQLFLIEIFAEILKLQPDAVFIFVGEGKDKARIMQKVDSCGLREHMIFMDYCEDVPSLMSALDVFLFPSIHEGLGIVLIEAQANGLPCLAFECIPEEVRITELLTIMKSSASAREWAKCALKQGKSGHCPAAGSKMKASRYDIEKEAVFLEEWLRGIC